MIESLRDGSVEPDDLCGSTSELITAFLDLPPPFEKKRDAWNRLDTGQRALVREFNPNFRAARWSGLSMYG
jgi:hypothetical protein